MRKHVLYLKGFLVSVFILFLFPAAIYASSSDVALWKSIYPSSNLSSTLGCSLCHTSAPQTNLYGSALLSAAGGSGKWGNSNKTSVIKSVEGLDSDGDGATNLTEINANTNPSDPNSKPAPPPPVTDTPPVARITVAKTTFTVGETATFSGSTSTDDKGITKYEWDFTSNGSIDATGVNATTSYPSAGAFKVTLKVTDTIGQTGTATVSITVNAAVAPPPTKPPTQPPSGDRDDDSKKKEDRKKKEDEERRKRK